MAVLTGQRAVGPADARCDAKPPADALRCRRGVEQRGWVRRVGNTFGFRKPGKCHISEVLC